MNRSLSRSLGVAALAFCLLPAGGRAAGPGTAYDAITRFGSGDAAPQPGSFHDDFAAASAVKPAAAPHMPFGLGKMVGGMQNMTSMFAHGSAEKHYVAGTKERTDSLATQTADITDCTARTITHLDLAKKTYTVTSMDQPVKSAPSGPSSRHEPGTMPSDDGTRFKIDVATKALGPLTIDGNATNGYHMTVTMTAIRPGSAPQSSTYELTQYFANFAEPQFSCPERAAMPPGGGAAGAGMGMAQLGLIMKAMHTPSGDPRFAVTMSGPALPSSRMSLWTLMTLSMGAHGQTADPGAGGGFYVLTERGDVHATSDGDPVFSVPPDFTKIS